jgi:hypothetical protein
MAVTTSTPAVPLRHWRMRICELDFTYNNKMFRTHNMDFVVGTKFGTAVNIYPHKQEHGPKCVTKYNAILNCCRGFRDFQTGYNKI